MKITTAKDGRQIIVYKDGEGRRRQIKTDTRSKKMAMQIATIAKIPEMEDAAQAQALSFRVFQTLMGVERVKITESTDQYLAWREARVRSLRTYVDAEDWIKAWLKFMAKDFPKVKYVTELQFEHFNNYINVPGSRARTRKQKINTIRSYARWLSRDQNFRLPFDREDLFIDWKGMTHAQKLTKVRPPFSEEEFHTLSVHIDRVARGEWIEGQIKTEKRRHVVHRDWWQHAVPISYWAGLRLSDILNLEWDMISDTDILVKTIKQGVWVTLPLDHEVCGFGVLRDVFEKVPRTESNYVFPMYQHYCGLKRFSMGFGEIIKKAGLSGRGLCFHSLRHSFGHRLKALGLEINDIAQYMGHKNTSTTKGYLMK